jgi:cell division protein ZapA
MATYKVTIMGRDYNLTSEENKDYTERLAAALDKRLKDMKMRFSSFTVTDCAILTALDCMDELGQSNRNIDNIRTQIKDYVDDAGRARTQAVAAQREIQMLKERVEQLERELAERTNYSSVNNVGEAVSAEDILRGDIKAAIGETAPAEKQTEEKAEPKRSIQNSPYMRSFEQAMNNNRVADGAAGGLKFRSNGQESDK